jgi:hypothetical protein
MKERHTMSISESDRLELHLKLRNMMGDDMADILMEHLPPSGWGDVARKSDIDFLATLMSTKFEANESRFKAIDARFEYLEAGLRGVQHAMWALASLTAACHIATFTILATQL